MFQGKTCELDMVFCFTLKMRVVALSSKVRLAGPGPAIVRFLAISNWPDNIIDPVILKLIVSPTETTSIASRGEQSRSTQEWSFSSIVVSTIHEWNTLAEQKSEPIFQVQDKKLQKDFSSDWQSSLLSLVKINYIFRCLCEDWRDQEKNDSSKSHQTGQKMDRAKVKPFVHSRLIFLSFWFTVVASLYGV